MTTSPELLEHAAAAVAWLRESGWPTRKHDVEIAVEVYMRPTRRRQCLATALEHALGRKGSREDHNHRIVLCRMGHRHLDEDGLSTGRRSSALPRTSSGAVAGATRSLGLRGIVRRLAFSNNLRQRHTQRIYSVADI